VAERKGRSRIAQARRETVPEKWPVSQRVNFSRAPDDDPMLIDKVLTQDKNWLPQDVTCRSNVAGATGVPAVPDIVGQSLPSAGASGQE
jgi:hypothetical protein